MGGNQPVPGIPNYNPFADNAVLPRQPAPAGVPGVADFSGIDQAPGERPLGTSLGRAGDWGEF